LTSDDPCALEDHEQDRQQERRPEPEHEVGDEIEVVANAGQRLLPDAADVALVAQKEMQRPRHGKEVGEAGSGREEQRRREKEGQECPFLLRVEAGGDKAPQLCRDDREAQHDRREQRDLHLDEESLEHVSVDQPSLPGLEQRLHQHGEDVLGEVKADEEKYDQRDQRPEKSPPELDQMFEQRLLGLVDVLHGSGRSSGGRSSSGWRSSNGRVGSSTSARGGISSALPGSE